MLIGPILIGYNYYFAPQVAPESTATEQADPEPGAKEGASQQAVSGAIAISDSLKELQLREKLAYFTQKCCCKGRVLHPGK